MSGRKSDHVWQYFETKNVAGKAGCRATCKKCGKEMQGLVARLKQHYHDCAVVIDYSNVACADLDISQPDIQLISQKRISGTSSAPKTKKHKSSSMTNFVIQTSKTEKATIDLQIARFVCATNSPFSIVEHPEFLKLMAMLRPGYDPPNRHKVSNELLDELYGSMQSECTEQLVGKNVSMMLDGWSNIHNEPVICVSVTTSDGESYLTETVDTSGHAHTAEYLKEVAMSAVISTEQRYGCKVGTLVTDNAANMVKMRRQVASDSHTNETNIISYGCSAHYLNLLAKDVEIPSVKEHIIQIVKYFRNSHLPAAWYKSTGGRKLVLPQEVR